MIDKIFHGFEKGLAAVLLLLISIVAALAVVELCFLLYRDLVGLRIFLLNERGMFDLFGMFLIVLIAIELMASIHMYMKDKSVHAELMLLIAVTALTRKVVVLDADAQDPMYLIGLAALLGTLIGGYYLVRRLGPAHHVEHQPPPSEAHPPE